MLLTVSRWTVLIQSLSDKGNCTSSLCIMQTVMQM